MSGRAPVLPSFIPQNLRGGSRVISVTRPLQVSEGSIRLRADLSALDYAAYLMDEAGLPGDQKGHHGTAPALFTGGSLMPPPAWFAKKWGERPRTRTLKEAWCINILRADLPGEPHVYSTAVSFRRPDVLRSDGTPIIKLEPFAKRLMEQVREDHFGAPFLWAGACHYNTNNPHVHIIIRGVLDIEEGNEKSGMLCKIHQGYLQKAVRSRAINLLERMHDETRERRVG